MAIVYGVNYTDAFIDSPPEAVHASKWGGKVVSFYDTYEASSLALGSTIYCFRPPKGARWVGYGRLWSRALGTGVTLAVGIPGATGRFLAATAHASATMTELGAAATIDSVGYEFDGATDVIITTGGGSATGTIVLWMLFAVA